MKIVEYSARGKPVSDFDVEGEYELFLRSANDYWRYSSEVMFTRIRLGIIQGELSHKDVKFKFQDKELELNEYAKLDWPLGFCDVNIIMSEKILRGASNMYKKKQEAHK